MGASMTGFGGWDMPLFYKGEGMGIKNEHLHCPHKCWYGVETWGLTQGQSRFGVVKVERICTFHIWAHGGRQQSKSICTTYKLWKCQKDEAIPKISVMDNFSGYIRLFIVPSDGPFVVPSVVSSVGLSFVPSVGPSVVLSVCLSGFICWL